MNFIVGNECAIIRFFGMEYMYITHENMYIAHENMYVTYENMYILYCILYIESHRALGFDRI